jgi:hypothetical protein
MDTTERLSPAAKRLAGILKDDWRDTAAITGRFAGRAGYGLKYGILRRRILHAATELCDLGKAELKTESGPDGEQVDLVRRCPAKPALSSEQAARSGDTNSVNRSPVDQKNVASPKKCNENRHNSEVPNVRKSESPHILLSMERPRIGTARRGWPRANGTHRPAPAVEDSLTAP